MKKIASNKFLRKATAVYMVVVLGFANFPISVFAEGLSVDLVVNGANSLTLTDPSQSFVYSWSSQNATACEFSSPGAENVSVSGSSEPVVFGTQFYYPKVGESITYRITCFDSTGASVSDSVTVSYEPTPPSIPAPTVDLVANGSNGPLTLTNGETFIYTWSSQNATACEFTSPGAENVSISGSSESVGPGNIYYPAVGGSKTFTINCGNGTDTATDSVVVNIVGTTTPPVNPSVSVDIKANGSDGPLTINTGDSYIYSWSSQNASACEITSPATENVSTQGSSASITSGHPFYPTTNSPVTLSITCVNSSSTATDSVVVNLAPTNDGGGNHPSVTVDLVANGSNGPLTINNGETFIYTWSSQNATACHFTSPGTESVSISGSSESVGPGNIYYPAVNGSKTFTIVCENSTSSATDTVVVNVVGTVNNCPVPEITSSLTVSVNEDSLFSYTITSSPTDAHITVNNLPSGLTFSTSTKVISGTIADPGTYNVTINADNTCGSTSKTLAITVNNVGGGGGGGDNNGGGSSSGGGRHHRSGGGTVKGEEFQCLWLTDYMRRDFDNDPIQVMRLQAFLIGMEGHNEVTVNGVFDQATFDAVSAFQMKYKDDILTPWGHTAPTGYVYILTLKKINEIYCHRVFPLNEAQINEIAAFRALLAGLRAQGYNVDGYNPVTSTPDGGKEYAPESDSTTTGATTTPNIPIVGKNIYKGQNIRNIAGAIFTIPGGWMEGLQCLYEFILILIVLYVLASVLEDVLEKKDGVDLEKKFRNKWAAIVSGIVLAIILAYIFNEWCLLLPLIVALILSVVWIVIRPNHSSIKASIKSWYLVLMARSKSIANNARNSAKANMDRVAPKTETKKEDAPEIKTPIETKKEETKEIVKVEEEKKEIK